MYFLTLWVPIMLSRTVRLYLVIQVYFSEPWLPVQPSQCLAIDLGYGGIAGSTLFVRRFTL